MSIKTVLADLAAVLRAQSAAVMANDADALVLGTRRHEELLSVLERAQPAEGAAELRPLYEEVQFERTKLQTLLLSESVRVEFLLRIILGGARQPAGYPGSTFRLESAARVLNRRA